MPQYKDTKAHRAEQELLRQIKLGNYPRGSRLPSTQELAQQLNVSHMTIRKIVAKLTAEGFLYNNLRVGTFVSNVIPEHKLHRQLGIVFPAYANPFFMEIMMQLNALFEANNWLCRFVFARHWEDVAIQEVKNNTDALVFYSIRPLPEENSKIRQLFENAAKPVVFIGNPGSFNVDTVSFDDKACFQMLFEKLRQKGHRKIGFVTQKATDRWKRPENEELFLQFASEQSWCEVYDYTVDCPSFASPADPVYDYFYNHVQDDCTVLIGTNGLLFPAGAALQDKGLKIDRISLGNTQTFKYVRPKVTSFHFSLEALAEQVRDLILYRLEHPDAPVRKEKIAPDFIPGDTF